MNIHAYRDKIPGQINQRSKLVSGHSFVDKLSERMAFEKTIIRLYEALLAKYQNTKDSDSLPPLELLRQFHREEQDHLHLLHEVLNKVTEESGSSPVSTTNPIAALGWNKVIGDPKATFEQCLHVLHLAELEDNDSWEFLIEQAEAHEMKEYAGSFREALAQEENHLLNVRNWMRAFFQIGDEDHGINNSH